MAFPALQHVAITVSDLERSTQWYSPIAPAPSRCWTRTRSRAPSTTRCSCSREASSSACTPTWATSPAMRSTSAAPGLDHVGFALSGTAELEQWRDRLDELGIAHGGMKKAGYGSGLSFRDPDNIALEFFIAPGT